MKDHLLLRGLMLDTLDAQAGKLPEADLARSRQILMTHFSTSRSTPYESFTMLLAEHDLVHVAKSLIESHGPTSQVLEIDAEPGELVTLERVAFPGDIRTQGILRIDGVVAGAIEAQEIHFDNLEVGSHLAAHKIVQLGDTKVGALNVPDIHENTVFIRDTEAVKPEPGAPKLTFSGPGETFH